MSTRSEIAIEMEDKSIKSIYCHSDGYLEHNGVLLNRHYGSYDLALSIINENDCSILGETIEKSRFYNTWRDEDTKAREFHNEYHFMTEFGDDIFAEYIYLFKDDKWYVSELKFVKDDEYKDNYHHCIGYHTKFTLLEDLLELLNDGGES
jgi:hypothetical protein